MVRVYKRTAEPLFAMLLFLSVIPVAAVYSQDAIDRGLNAFSEGRYERALEIFEDIGAEHDLAAEALFWTGRSHLALGEYGNAISSFQEFIEEHPGHSNAEEAMYQIGRAEYLRSNYEDALVAFEQFASEYPDSDYLGNAGYWSGESLLALGRHEEARRLFQTVVEQFPRSYRVEAARYRMELIDLSRRERELLELLRWSNEEQLRLSRLLQQKDRAYRQAVESYQEQVSADPEDSSDTEESTEERREREEMRDELEERLEAVRLREQALELRESFRTEQDENE